MKDKSILRKKLELLSAVPTTSTTVKAVSITGTAPAKKSKEKAEPCFIYLGRLKENPKIMITQLRFEAFANIEECETWCKEHCVAYEIRSHKTNKTLIKTDK